MNVAQFEKKATNSNGDSYEALQDDCNIVKPSTSDFFSGFADGNYTSAPRRRERGGTGRCLP
jgi:hypothetical protein